MKVGNSYIFLVFAAFMMMSACGKQTAQTVAEGGVAELSITVRTSEITKATGASSGDALNNLRLWLVDTNKNIVKFVKTDDWQTFSGTTEAMFDDGHKTATIKFSDIYRATYTLYAVANYKGLDGYDGVAKTKIDDAFVDMTLPEMSDPQTPYSDENGMPLSVSKTIQLLPGENRVSAELERVLAYFSIKIKNQSDGHQIVIGDASLSDFNMSNTYLFRHSDENRMPADCEDLPMPAFDDLPLSIGSGSVETVYSTYLYGGTSNSGYKLRMAVGAFSEEQSVTGLSAEGAVKIVEDGHEVKADGTEYMIRSCYGTSSGYPCLYLNGTSLGIRALTDSDIEAMSEADLKPYLWTFTDEDEGYVRSAYDLKYHLNSRNNQLEASQSQKTEFMFDFREAKPDRMYFMAGGKGLYLGYEYDYYWNRSYYVSTNGPSSILDSSGDQYFWKLLPLSDVKWSNGTVTADGSTFIARDLTSFDEYNVPQPLTALWRNQRLTTTITVTFMSQTGAFDYVVEDWKESGGSASFN